MFYFLLVTYLLAPLTHCLGGWHLKKKTVLLKIIRQRIFFKNPVLQISIRNAVICSQFTVPVISHNLTL